MDEMYRSRDSRIHAAARGIQPHQLCSRQPRQCQRIDRWTAGDMLLFAGRRRQPRWIPDRGSACARQSRRLALYVVVEARRAYRSFKSGLAVGDRLIIHASDEGQRINLDETFARLPPDALAAICGPMRLLEAARRSWASAGRLPTDLRYETFGSSGLLPTASFRVRIDNSSREIVVPENKSMLDALNEAGFEVMSDCQRGECGVCAIDVVSVDGQIDHRDVFFSNHQKKTNGKICPCVSRAVGAITVNTLYRNDAR